MATINRMATKEKSPPNSQKAVDLHTAAPHTCTGQATVRSPNNNSWTKSDRRLWRKWQDNAPLQQTGDKEHHAENIKPNIARLLRTTTKQVGKVGAKTSRGRNKAHPTVAKPPTLLIIAIAGKKMTVCRSCYKIVSNPSTDPASEETHLFHIDHIRRQHQFMHLLGHGASWCLCPPPF